MRVILVYEFWRDNEHVTVKVEKSGVKTLEDELPTKEEINWWLTTDPLPDGTKPMEQFLSIKAAIGPE